MQQTATTTKEGGENIRITYLVCKEVGEVVYPPSNGKDDAGNNGEQHLHPLWDGALLPQTQSTIHPRTCGEV